MIIVHRARPSERQVLQLGRRDRAAGSELLDGAPCKNDALSGGVFRSVTPAIKQRIGMPRTPQNASTSSARSGVVVAARNQRS